MEPTYDDREVSVHFQIEQAHRQLEAVGVEVRTTPAIVTVTNQIADKSLKLSHEQLIAIAELGLLIKENPRLWK